MAMDDNTVLPAPTGAGGMSPQIQAFLNLLMGGGLTPFGAFGGQPFGGFGHFLMNNPSLMHGLGLAGGAPSADVAGPTAVAPPPVTTPTAAAPASSNPPTTPSPTAATPTDVALSGLEAFAPGFSSRLSNAQSMLGTGGASSPLPLLRKG